MKICMIAEGCYPFIPGGVSSWLQQLIERMPEHEVVIWAIGAQEKMRGHYAYKMPANVVKLEDIYLDTVLHDHIRSRGHGFCLNDQQLSEISKLLRCENPDWSVLYDCFTNAKAQSTEFLLDRNFLEIIKTICAEQYPYVAFSDFFWTVRSMFLPLLYMLQGHMPEADLYHSVSAGYAGVLGAMAAQHYHKPYVVTEHGIYTREREEEILRSDWVPPYFKDLWINMFYMFTHCAYNHADVVTCLFQHASEIQQEIGCPAEKSVVVQNGVHLERFADVPLKQPDGWVDIGAVVRVVPIKDIKTMLYAFSHVCEELSNVRLHIMGNTSEDEEYYQECLELSESLQLSHVIFTGNVNVKEYLAKIDFNLLTSISEGQPLAVLEAMAAGRPSVTTDVGCCRELISGVKDGFGEAGFCVPAMHQTALAEAMVRLCKNETLRLQMGRNGKDRVTALFSHERMMAQYRNVYTLATDRAKEKWR